MGKLTTYFMCHKIAIVCGILFWLFALRFTLVVYNKNMRSRTDLFDLWKVNEARSMGRRRLSLRQDLGFDEAKLPTASLLPETTMSKVEAPNAAWLLDWTGDVKVPAGKVNTLTAILLHESSRDVNASTPEVHSRMEEEVKAPAEKVESPTTSLLHELAENVRVLTAKVNSWTEEQAKIRNLPTTLESTAGDKSSPTQSAKATDTPKPVAAAAAAANADASAPPPSLPHFNVAAVNVDPACASRDEWRAACSKPNTAAPLHRYLLVGPLQTSTGIGHYMAAINYLVRLSLRYNLQLVLRRPLMNRDDLRIHDTMGLSTHPSLITESSSEVWQADFEVLPETSKEDREAVLEREMNRTRVTYDPRSSAGLVNGHWALPVPGVEGPPECVEPRFLLRDWFWRVPRRRALCDRHLAGGGEGRWVVAVHVRRGDIANARFENWQHRNLQHSWYVQAHNKVLRAIAEVEKGARVSVLVFSQGTNGSMVDEWGRLVTWGEDGAGVCRSAGLRCEHRTVLDSTPMEALECLAGADVMVGSRSGFSHLAGMLSSNVKVVPKMWHRYAAQDSLTIAAVNGSGIDSEVKTSVLADLLRKWKHCGAHAIAQGNPYVHGYRIQV